MKIKPCWGRNIYYRQVRNRRKRKRREGIMLSHHTNINISVQKNRKIWIHLNLLSLAQCIAHSPYRYLVLIHNEFTPIVFVKGMAMGNSPACISLCVLNHWYQPICHLYLCCIQPTAMWLSVITMFTMPVVKHYSIIGSLHVDITDSIL